MYQMRFPDEDVSSLSKDQLRGREAARVRKIYKENAARGGIPLAGRNYRPGEIDASNPVNQALTAANAALYGIVHSVLSALGCSPGLGFVHNGTTRSFVYDMADLYEAEVSIPASFEVVAANVESPTTEVRRMLRDKVVSTRLLQRCARDLQLLLRDEASGQEQDWERQADDLSLWGDKGEASAGYNYAGETT